MLLWSLKVVADPPQILNSVSRKTRESSSIRQMRFSFQELEMELSFWPKQRIVTEVPKSIMVGGPPKLPKIIKIIGQWQCHQH